jgi:bacteriorhodopsin
MKYSFLSSSNKVIKTSKEEILEWTYRVTYSFLLLAFIVALVSSFCVKNVMARSILIIEVIISAVAAFVYSYYFSLLKKHQSQHTVIEFQTEKLRYFDWAITTPLMLCSLSLVLSMSSGVALDMMTVVVIVLLDWLMLYIGYLGETKAMGRAWASVLGFIPLYINFDILYNKFLLAGSNTASKLMFATYFTVWSTYGLVYIFDHTSKNISYNILDCIAKPFVALSLSGYFLSKLIYTLEHL